MTPFHIIYKSFVEITKEKYIKLFIVLVGHSLDEVLSQEVGKP